MSITKKCTYFILFFLTVSQSGFAQNRKNNQDSVLYSKLFLFGSDEYPKTLKQPNTYVLAFCRVLFKKNNEIDTITVYNTDNYEVINLLTERIKKVNFKKFKENYTCLLIPYVFTDCFENGSNASPTKVTDGLLSNMFDTHIKAKRKYGCKLLPPIYHCYSPVRKIS